jgi:hypothetical protein
LGREARLNCLWSSEPELTSAMVISTKDLLCSIGHLVAASAVYWHLINGGWLTNQYHLNDPNIVNLALAIFEPVAVLSVILYWIWRTPFLKRLVSILFLVQILIGAAFVLFVLLFAITWHPKMM